ncbi:MAG: hemin ABC transporter substrate-binding protein [Deltaproteobacteria bacterium]|nr:MAG: hemin ABC transporter substrate-binding protein [Deltaproteobacteria bacterium]
MTEARLRPLVLLLPLLALGAGAEPKFEGARHLGPPLDGPPQRIVTLAPSLTETVLALGAGDRLVGVSRFDDFEAVRALPRVGGYLDPNLEAILALHPDLVLAEKSPGNEAVVRDLARLGVPVLVVRARTLAEVREMIVAVAGALGMEAAGRGLLARFDAGLRAAQRLGPTAGTVRALLVYGVTPLVVAGPGSFGAELLSLCGAKNAAASGTGAYPTWPLERLIADPPDLIVVLSMTGTQDLGPLGRIERLRSRTVPLDATDLARPGPGLVRGARMLCETLRDHAPAGRRAAEAGGAP